MTIFSHVVSLIKSTKWSKKYVILFPLFVILVIGLWFFYQRLNIFQLIDYVEYWSAGRLTLTGGNPYDADEMLSMEQSVGWVDNDPLMMLNPPWSIPYSMIIGLPDYPLSRFFGYIFQIAIVGLCAVLLWSVNNGTKKYEWISWLTLFTFGPILQALKFGQINILILLGAVGFLFLIHRNLDFWAGVLVSLILVKPQLLYLLLITVVYWSITRHRYRVLAGIITSVLISMAITMLVNPNVIIQYIAMSKTYSYNSWMTSTIGSYLRVLLGGEKFYLQFIPVIFGLMWLLLYLYRQGKDFDWIRCMPLILLVSMVTTPYGWIFDSAILVVSVIPVALLLGVKKWSVQKFLIFSSYWAVNLMVLFISSTQHWFWWYTSFLLVWYLLSNKHLSDNQV